MKLDLLILQLAVLFLPGLIWARLDARFALTTQPSNVEFFLRAFQFGLVSYGVTFIIFSLFGWTFVLVNLDNAATHSVVTKSIFHEILWAVGIGLALSVIWIYAATYKWLTRFLRKIGATKTYGDEDVWDYLLNSSIAAVEYVHFRDFANEKVYAGWVLSFSETGRLRELVLRDVQTFDFDGQKLFETPMMYLARAPENIHIEFPYDSRAQDANEDRSAS